MAECAAPMSGDVTLETPGRVTLDMSVDVSVGMERLSNDVPLYCTRKVEEHIWRWRWKWKRDGGDVC